MTFEQLEAKFAALGDAAAALDDVRVLSAGDEHVAPTAFVGLDPQNRRHLLVPAKAGVPIRPDLRSAGIQVRGRTLVDHDVEHAYVDISCRSPHLNHVFTVVAAEILRDLEDNGETADTAASRVLDRWRELLARPPSVQTLTRSERLGLLAELRLLLDLTRIEPNAVSSWAGPTKGRHDFVSDAVDLEVKATASKGSRTIEVHGLEQLQADAGIDLYVVFYRMEIVPISGVSVGSSVDDLLNAGCPAVPLFDRLTAMGVRTDDFDEQDSVRVVDRAFYRVDDAFPRMLASDVSGWPRPGISYVRYGVDLGAAPAPLGDAEAAAVRAALAGRVSA